MHEQRKQWDIVIFLVLCCNKSNFNRLLSRLRSDLRCEVWEFGHSVWCREDCHFCSRFPEWGVWCLAVCEADRMFGEMDFWGWRRGGGGGAGGAGGGGRGLGRGLGVAGSSVGGVDGLFHVGEVPFQFVYLCTQVHVFVRLQVRVVDKQAWLYRAHCALCIALCGIGCSGRTGTATGCTGIVVAGVSTLGTAAACCVCRGRVDGTKGKSRLSFLCSVRGCFWYFQRTVFSGHTLPGFFAYSVSLVFILIYTHARPSPHSEEHPARAHCVAAVAKNRGKMPKKAKNMLRRTV